jgi:hypothetical protein
MTYQSASLCQEDDSYRCYTKKVDEQDIEDLILKLEDKIDARLHFIQSDLENINEVLYLKFNSLNKPLNKGGMIMLFSSAFLIAFFYTILVYNLTLSSKEYQERKEEQAQAESIEEEDPIGSSSSIYTK